VFASPAEAGNRVPDGSAGKARGQAKDRISRRQARALKSRVKAKYGAQLSDLATRASLGKHGVTVKVERDGSWTATPRRTGVNHAPVWRGQGSSRDVLLHAGARTRGPKGILNRWRARRLARDAIAREVKDVWKATGDQPSFDIDISSDGQFVVKETHRPTAESPKGQMFERKGMVILRDGKPKVSWGERVMVW
jgi:hypothetical protein